MIRTNSIFPIAVLAAMCVGIGGQTQSAETDSEVRFAAVDIFIDSGASPLAAYQFELSAEVGNVRIVGVEGGDAPAFSSPPYYDPAALLHERIVIADYNTGTEVDLPRGQIHVARLHLQISANAAPDYTVTLQLASDCDGNLINAVASVKSVITQGDDQ